MSNNSSTKLLEPPGPGPAEPLKPGKDWPASIAHAKADILCLKLALRECLSIMEEEFADYGPNERETHAIRMARRALGDE